MAWTVRAANAGDAEAACQVLRRSIAECCVEDHRNDSSVLDPWLRNKTPQNVRAWFCTAGNFPVVAEIDGSIGGVALMSPEGEIGLCYLLPEARFRGAGKALLSALEAEAVRRGLRSLHLESTVTAKPFYLRNGFESAGEPKAASGAVAFPLRKVLDRSRRLVETQSVITCPACGASATETMPLDACMYFYECTSCKQLLRPKPGDCCVFCSFGSVKCPPVQLSAGCCG